MNTFPPPWTESEEREMLQDQTPSHVEFPLGNPASAPPNVSRLPNSSASASTAPRPWSFSQRNEEQHGNDDANDELGFGFMRASEAGFPMPEDGINLAAPSVPVPLEKVYVDEKRARRLREAAEVMGPLPEGSELVLDEQAEQECFGCLWGRTGINAISAPEMDKLLRLIEENIGKLPDEAIAKAAASFFRKNIYERMRDAGKTCPPWTEVQILEHLREHIIEPRVSIVRDIRRINMMQELLLDRCFSQSPDDTQAVENLRTVGSVMQLMRQKYNLYGLDPKKLNFYNPNQHVDFTSVGHFVNMTGKKWSRSQLPSELL